MSLVGPKGLDPRDIMSIMMSIIIILLTVIDKSDRQKHHRFEIDKHYVRNRRRTYGKNLPR